MAEHHGLDETRVVWANLGTARHLARWREASGRWGGGWRTYCGLWRGLSDVPDPDEGASCRRCLWRAAR